MRVEVPRGQGDVLPIKPGATLAPSETVITPSAVENTPTREREVNISSFEQARQINILVENGQDWAIESAAFPDVERLALEESVFRATTVRILHLEVSKKEAKDPLTKRLYEGQMARLTHLRDSRIRRAYESAGIPQMDGHNSVGLSGSNGHRNSLSND